MASKSNFALLGRTGSSQPGAAPRALSDHFRQFEILLWPSALCAVSLVFGVFAVSAASINVDRLLSYFECATVTFLCVLVGVFIDVAVLAYKRADNPVQKVKKKLA